MKNVLLLGVVALALAPLDIPGWDLLKPKTGVGPKPRVERVIDRGLMIELIVTCHGATGIIVFSKVEKMFCTPHLLCHPSFGSAARSLCQRDEKPSILQ